MPVPRVLVVCTANRCRSPLAAALLQRYLGTESAIVTSAGLLPGGEAVPEAGLQIALAHGLDLSAHVSSQLSMGMLESADLVLTAGRSHAQEVLARAPDLWPRVFTLLQAERWWSEHPRAHGASLREWLDAEAADRSRREVVGASRDDDVMDPFGKSRRVWRKVFAVTDAAVAAVAQGIVGTEART